LALGCALRANIAHVEGIGRERGKEILDRNLRRGVEKRKERWKEMRVLYV